MNYSKSINEFSTAKELIPGGVNSPVRAFKNVNCSPVFIASAKGSQIIDIDGNKYIDFVSSWGPMILGHANEIVLNAPAKLNLSLKVVGKKDDGYHLARNEESLACISHVI